MRKAISALPILIVLLLFCSCGVNRNEVDNSGNQITVTPIVTEGIVMPKEGQPSELSEYAEADVTTLNIYAHTGEVLELIELYYDTHPEFAKRYKLVYVNGQVVDAVYSSFLYSRLKENEVDLFCFNDANNSIMEYIQGECGEYTASYREFGIDIDRQIAAAELSPYSVEIGTRPSDGEIAALSYQSTCNAFLYRRSVALDTWGTDDPDFIATKIGGGTNQWDAFLNAASELSEKGYGIISGVDDLWRIYKSTIDTAWVLNDKLNLNPDRLSFLEFYKQIREHHYDNGSVAWQDNWFADMDGSSSRPIFGFYAPSWFINFLLPKHSDNTFGDWAICEPNIYTYWDGTWVMGTKAAAGNPAKAAGVRELLEWLTLDTTEGGLQYQWATGTTNNSHILDAVPSNRVMATCEAKLDILGGQDMLDVFTSINRKTHSHPLTKHEETINIYWTQQVQEYANGSKSFEEAIADFKKNIKDNLGIIVE